MDGLTMDKPEPGKQYSLIGKKYEPSIAKGNSWKQSQIDEALKDLYYFWIDDELFTVSAPDYGKAMVKMNRDVVDKRGLHPMAWFGHSDDKNIPERTYVLKRGNFFD